MTHTTTTVPVTMRHILTGRRDSIWHSPVALALRDAFRATAAQAGETSFAVILEGRSPGVIRGTLPPQVAAFTADHDSGRRLGLPFTFTVGHAGMPIFDGPACGRPMRQSMGREGPCNRPAGHPAYHRRILTHDYAGYALGCRCATCSDGWAAFKLAASAGRGNQK